MHTHALAHTDTHHTRTHVRKNKNIDNNKWWQVTNVVRGNVDVFAGGLVGHRGHSPAPPEAQV